MKMYSQRKRAASRDRKRGRGVSWLAVWDDNSQSYQYVNEATNETVREQPTEGVVLKKSDEKGTLYLNHETGEWEAAQGTKITI